MPRIAIVLPDLRGGGVERVRLVLAREFLGRGIDVDLVLLNAIGDLLSEVPARCRVFDLSAPRIRHAVRALAGYLRQEKPDAVLAALWPLTVAAVLAKKMAGYRGRVVVSDHSILSRQYRTRAQRLMLQASVSTAYRAAQARVGVSSGVVDDLSRLSRMTPSRFHVIHNPIPLPSDAPCEPAPWPVTGGSKILTVGNLKPVKNHALLIRAVALLSADVDVSLVVLGEGGLRADLQRLIDELGLTSRVVLRGFEADPSPWYRAADLFVLSSDFEGFGNVIVEALAHGLPVVSTNCPSGPAEILEDGRYGTLVPVGDAAALAQAMREALEAPRDPARLKERAGAFAVEPAVQAYLSLLLPAHQSG